MVYPAKPSSVIEFRAGLGLFSLLGNGRYADRAECGGRGLLDSLRIRYCTGEYAVGISRSVDLRDGHQ